MLAYLNKNVKFTEEQIAALIWEQKIKLIQSDSVKCSRYFDHRVKEFINIVLRNEHKPLGKLTDFFYRVEPQQRGSPHTHMIVFIEDAPKFNENSNNEIINFVGEYLQCSIDDHDIGHHADLLIHSHSMSCRKKQDNKIKRRLVTLYLHFLEL